MRFFLVVALFLGVVIAVSDGMFFNEDADLDSSQVAILAPLTACPDSLVEEHHSCSVKPVRADWTAAITACMATNEYSFQECSKYVNEGEF
jgi:hypothetical protein